MTTTSNTTSGGARSGPARDPAAARAGDREKSPDFPRVLVWTWVSPLMPSGSPAILAEVLKRIPPGSAEIVCEYTPGRVHARQDEIPHAVSETRVLHVFWPFRRGWLPRRVSRILAFPLLVMYGLWRIWRYRPDCILTLYFDSLWILSSYLLSKLTGTPVVYYVHDPYLEYASFRGGFNARLAAWLEPRSLRHATVLVLYDSLRKHYHQRYGIEATVVRHLAGRTAEVAGDDGATAAGAKRVIGFAGAIYDNNRRLLKQLIAECGADDRFEIRIWSNAAPDVLEEIGANRPGVTVSFESVYDRLLEALGKCDLMYLPLAFGNTPTLPEDSLRYVLPTKAVDYLLVGKPILVHCPSDFEMATFFEKFRAGHCLTDDAEGSLHGWLSRWQAGEIPAIAAADRRQALDQFCADRNSAVLFDRLREVAGAQ